LNRSSYFVGMAVAVLLSAGMASAQTPANIAVVSGNGQLICQNCVDPAALFFQPLTVRVTDANGQPVGLATVHWSMTSGFNNGQLLGDTSYTDGNGYASITYLPNSPAPASLFNPFVQTTIVATAGNASATFTLTQGQQIDKSFTGGFFQNPFIFRTPQDSANMTQGTLFTGQVGSTAPTPFKIQIITNGLGAPVPNIAVRIINVNAGTSTVTCRADPGAGEGTVLTDQTGTATCYPIFGGVPNVTGQFYLSVGGAYPPEHFTAGADVAPFSFVQYPFPGSFLLVRSTPGVPSAFRLVSGNGQTQLAGQSVTAPFVVQVQSSDGSPLAGQTIKWTLSPSNAGSLGAGTTTTDASGNSSNTLLLSPVAAGPVTVTATLQGSNLPALTFTTTAGVPVTLTGLSMVSGNSQSALAGAAFGAPLVVQLNTTAGVAAGVPVTFTVTGPATLSSNTVNTGSNGQASVTVQAAGAAGNVTVTASAGGFSQTFNLVVSPPGPSLSATGFLNAADLQRGSLSPCSWATLVAPGIAPALQTMVTGGLVPGLDLLLANDTVTVAGSQAPLFGVGVNNDTGLQQATFQVPCDVVPGSSVPVTVTVGAGSATINIPVQAASPGVFQARMSDGLTRAIMIRPDGSRASLTNPARRGENVTVYVTGLGAANTPVTTGGVAPMGATITPRGTVVVGMAGRGVPLVSAQLSQDIVGVWLVTFTIPNDVPTGNNVTFSVSVIPAGSSTPIPSATTNIPVQ
jgi:uncharacterized protein (TIGR03437 family)